MEGKVTKYRKGQGSTIIEEEEESNSLEDEQAKETEVKQAPDEPPKIITVESSGAHTPD